MNSSLWIVIATAIGSVIAALASGELIKAIQSKRKTSLEAKKIEEDVIASIRAREDRRYGVVLAHARLWEYKFDILLEEHLKLIDRVRDTCPAQQASSLAELRASALRIKYVDRIPNENPPPPYPE